MKKERRIKLKIQNKTVFKNKNVLLLFDNAFKEYEPSKYKDVFLNELGSQGVPNLLGCADSFFVLDADPCKPPDTSPPPPISSSSSTSSSSSSTISSSSSSSTISSSSSSRTSTSSSSTGCIIPGCCFSTCQSCVLALDGEGEVIFINGCPVYNCISGCYNGCTNPDLCGSSSSSSSRSSSSSSGGSGSGGSGTSGTALGISLL